MMHHLQALSQRVSMMLTRAKNVLAGYSPTGARTMVQVKGVFGDVLQNIELLLPYGFSAMPVGQTADYLVFQIGAGRDHLVAIAGDDPACRISGLQPGEFGLQDNQGQQIVIKRTGIYMKDVNGNTLVLGPGGIKLN